MLVTLNVIQNLMELTQIYSLLMCGFYGNFCLQVTDVDDKTVRQVVEATIDELTKRLKRSDPPGVSNNNVIISCYYCY